MPPGYDLRAVCSAFPLPIEDSTLLVRKLYSEQANHDYRAEGALTVNCQITPSRKAGVTGMYVCMYIYTFVCLFGSRFPRTEIELHVLVFFIFCPRC